jgi:hypothetical protein
MTDLSSIASTLAALASVLALALVGVVVLLAFQNRRLTDQVIALKDVTPTAIAAALDRPYPRSAEDAPGGRINRATISDFDSLPIAPSGYSQEELDRLSREAAEDPR